MRRVAVQGGELGQGHLSCHDAAFYGEPLVPAPQQGEPSLRSAGRYSPFAATDESAAST